jgi:hypothetical protein
VQQVMSMYKSNPVDWRRYAKFDRCRWDAAERQIFVGSVLLTAMAMKSFVFFDISSWIVVKVNRFFSEEHRIRLQGRRVNKARSQLRVSFLFGLFFCCKGEAIYSCEMFISPKYTALNLRRHSTSGTNFLLSYSFAVHSAKNLGSLYIRWLFFSILLCFFYPSLRFHLS